MFNDFVLSFAYVVFYVVVCVLQYFRCKSGFKIPKFMFHSHQLNALTPESGLLIAVSFGFFFVGMLLFLMSKIYVKI